MNKGMQKWINHKAKVKKNITNARKVTEEEKNIDRYIKYSKVVFDKPIKRMHKVGMEYGIGHQIKNRCYLVDGSYHLVGMKSFKIIKKYDKEMPLESHIVYDKQYKKLYGNESVTKEKQNIPKKNYKEEIFHTGNIECHKLTYDDGKVEYKRYDKDTGKRIDM